MNLPRIQPINPSRIAAAFDHPDFLFELKDDGFRGCRLPGFSRI
jgi:hypothetical protein